MVTLKFLKLHDDVNVPEYKTEGASGMDVEAYLKEPVTLSPLERILIPTGLKAEIPQGYEIQLRARSGLSIKHGITLINAIGTVDSDYRGEICVGLVNLSNESYTINPGERIAQIIVCKVEHPAITICEELSSSIRGEGGFGSTGK